MKIILVVLYLLSSDIVIAQVITEKWVRDNYIKEEYYIPMRDSVKLYTVVYRPKENGISSPILFERTIYSCAPYGGEKYTSKLWSPSRKAYLKERYTLVFQDVRGRWMSEGDFVDMRPCKHAGVTVYPNESDDTYQTIDWLLDRIPTNGKVCLQGNSYSGFYVIMGGLCGHPAICAANAQAPAVNWFLGDDFHHNGALMLSDAFHFFLSNGRIHPNPTPVMPTKPIYYVQDDYHFFLKQGTLSQISLLLGDSLPFWSSMMEHPDYDEWWQERDACSDLKNWKIPLLITGGFLDAEDCYGALQLYREVKRESPHTPLYMVFGPWAHGGWNTIGTTSLGDMKFDEDISFRYKTEMELPFFNYHAKNKGDLSSHSQSRIYFSGSNKWVDFAEWPPASCEKKRYFLADNGQLISEIPDMAKSKSSYLSDPNKPVPYSEKIRYRRDKSYMTADQRFVTRRPDVLSFQTEPFDSDVTLSGPIKVDFSVSLSTTDADFIVKIIDVYPSEMNTEVQMNGYQMLIRGDVFRGRYRNSFSVPEPFHPGKPTKLSFDLNDVAHTFKRGHRLMIQIQSSWFPLVDRNPQQFLNIYRVESKDFVQSEITLYHNRKNHSSIEVHILK